MVRNAPAEGNIQASTQHHLETLSALPTHRSAVHDARPRNQISMQVIRRIEV